MDILFFEKSAIFKASLYILAIAFCAVYILVGGLSPMALALVAILALLFTFLLKKNEIGFFHLPNIIYCLIAIFLAGSFISIFHSYNIHQSVITLTWVLLATLLGFQVMPLVNDKQNALFFSNLAVVAGVFVALVGFVLYFLFDDYGNPQMFGTFFSHNAFAGFILLPLSLALPAFAFAVSKQARIWYGLASVIIFSAFMLSFSRGGWVAFTLSWLAIFILAIFKKEAKINKNKIIYMVGIFILAFLISFGTHSIKMSLAPKSPTAPVSSQHEELIGGDNAASSRIQYMKYGAIIAKSNPVFGVGIGAYKNAEPVYRLNPIFQTVDPHNLYIRLFAETGIVGGLSFLGIIICLIWLIIKTLWKRNTNEFSFVEVGLLGGIIAVLLHNFIEVNWYFPLHTLFTIISFFVLYTVLAENKKEISERGSNILSVTFLIIILCLSGLSVLMFVGNNIGMDGGFFESKDKIDEAQNAYESGLHYDKWNPDVSIGYATFLYKRTQDIKDVEIKKGLLLEIQKIIDQALIITPYSHKLYDLRASVDKDLGDNISQDDDLLKAINSDPTLNLPAYLLLSTNYITEKRYNDALNLANRALAYYPPESFKNPFWVSQDKASLKFDLVFVISNKFEALNKITGKDHSKELQVLLKQY